MSGDFIDPQIPVGGVKPSDIIFYIEYKRIGETVPGSPLPPMDMNIASAKYDGPLPATRDTLKQFLTEKGMVEWTPTWDGKAPAFSFLSPPAVEANLLSLNAQQ